jgi:hypothetical protein
MGEQMAKKHTVLLTTGLFLAAGLVLGISTLPGRTWADEEQPGAYEPFIECSADYADGPGAELDRNNMIGAENSVIISPDEMKAMGFPEAQIRAQTAEWNKLSPEEREEQLCRAAQQNSVVDQ